MPAAERDGASLVSAAPVPSRCAICGDELGDVFWMITYPQGAHTRCIDWSSRAFPYAWRIEPLRVLERTLHGDARAAAHRARYVLEAGAARWPRDAARILDGCHAEVEKARARLSALGVERRRLQRF